MEANVRVSWVLVTKCRQLMSEGFKRFHYKFQKKFNVMHRFAGSVPGPKVPGYN